MTTPADNPWQTLLEEPLLLRATYSRQQVGMVALRLKSGGFVVYSPGSRSRAAQSALEKHGEPRFLLAPNHFHNAGLADWQAAYPKARVVAAAVAHKRLRKQVPSLTAIDDLDVLAKELPDGCRVFGPPMAKQGETFLSIKSGQDTALVVCDAICNLPTVGAPFWLLGFRARLITNPFFKRIFLKNKAAYKAWMVSELRDNPPTLFVPSHGNVLSGNGLAADLERITNEA